jgi:hypothetical protein
LLRIVGHSQDPNSPGTPAAVAQWMAALRTLPGHAFWPDDISLADTEHTDTARLLSSAQVTDTYHTCWPWLGRIAVSWPASTGACSLTRCRAVRPTCI